MADFFACTCRHQEVKQQKLYQRAAKKIPVVLSAEKVASFLEAAAGLGFKYRAAFCVSFGVGLLADSVALLEY